MALEYFILLVLSLVSRVHSHASGTGIDSACDGMTPGHGVAAQISPSPYYIDVVPNYYRPGQTVTVYIGSNGNATFRGFMIQSRRASLVTSSNERFGNFTVVNNTTTACSGQALVHSNNLLKTSLTLNWTAPSIPSGDIIFKVTFVHSYSVFWTNDESEIVYDVDKMQTTTWGLNSTSRYNSTSGYNSTSEYYYNTTIYSGPTVLSKDYYCGFSYGCFSYCSSYGCDFLVTWSIFNGKVAYTMKSSYPAPGFYMALGLSSDNKMGDDSVIGCAYQNNEISAFSAFTSAYTTPVQFYDEEVTLLSGLYSDGILTCTIARPISGQGNRYDASNYWTLFFAKGVANIVNGKIHIYYHEGDVHISRDKVSAYSSSDVQSIQTEEDGVNADSADSLMHIGYLKLFFISAAVIYYLFN